MALVELSLVGGDGLRGSDLLVRGSALCDLFALALLGLGSDLPLVREVGIGTGVTLNTGMLALDSLVSPVEECVWLAKRRQLYIHKYRLSQ